MFFHSPLPSPPKMRSSLLLRFSRPVVGSSIPISYLSSVPSPLIQSRDSYPPWVFNLSRSTHPTLADLNYKIQKEKRESGEEDDVEAFGKLEMEDMKRWLRLMQRDGIRGQNEERKK